MDGEGEASVIIAGNDAKEVHEVNLKANSVCPRMLRPYASQRSKICGRVDCREGTRPAPTSLRVTIVGKKTHRFAHVKVG